MKTYNCLNCQAECKASSQKVNKYCSVRCQKEYEYKQNIANWLKGDDPGGSKYSTRGWVKRYVLEKQQHECAACGITEHNGKPIVLELDHVDGNPYNNHESNLRCICPNCHSQSENYKAKNKGNGRSHRTEQKLHS